MRYPNIIGLFFQILTILSICSGVEQQKNKKDKYHVMITLPVTPPISENSHGENQIWINPNGWDLKG